MRMIETDSARLAMFDDMQAQAAWLAPQVKGLRSARDDNGDFFGCSMDSALELTRNGDISLVDKSTKLMEKYEELAFSTLKRAWRNDVTGARPDVQAFIAGQPLSMRRRVKVESDNAPIVVFVDLFASCGFTKEQITARGAACLALVRILSTRRAVQLHVGCSTVGFDKKYFAPIVQIDCAPLDMARAAYALVSASYLRRVMFATCDVNKCADHIPAFSDDIRARIAPAFSGCELLISPAMVGSPNDPSAAWNNPEAFIDNAIRTASPDLID